MGYFNRINYKPNTSQNRAHQKPTYHEIGVVFLTILFGMTIGSLLTITYFQFSQTKQVTNVNCDNSKERKLIEELRKEILVKDQEMVDQQAKIIRLEISNQILENQLTTTEKTATENSIEAISEKDTDENHVNLSTSISISKSVLLISTSAIILTLIL